ncbi:MAG: alpha/beta hydrolase [Actinomycetota bacterium]
MIETPLFVPHDGAHLAALLARPERKARSLVLILPGVCGLRGGRAKIWTRTARELAERGIASVRIDYEGTGDSTGVCSTSFSAPAVREADTIVNTLMPQLGVDSFAIIGNCIGARVGLLLAAERSSCIGLACSLHQGPRPLLEKQGVGPSRLAMRRIGIAFPRLLGLARRSRFFDFAHHHLHFIPEVPRVLQSTPTLFLLVGSETTRSRMERALARVQPKRNAPPSLSRLIGGPETTNPEIADVEIASLVEWLDTTLPKNGSEAQVRELRDARARGV